MISNSSLHSEDGSTLAGVLILIVIITVFIGAVLSAMVVQNRFLQRDINETKARYAAEAGIAAFLDNTPYRSIKRDTSVTMFIQDSKEVSVKARLFGGFLDIQSTAYTKEREKTIRVLAGASSNEFFSHAVVLGDSNSVLYLTGSAELTGDIITGSRGVQTTSFKGIPFSGNIAGERIQKSGDLLPNFDVEFIQNQERLFAETFDDREFSSQISNYNGRLNLNFQKNDTLYFEESISWISQEAITFPDDVTIVVNGNAAFNGEYNFGRFTRLIVKDTLQLGGSAKGENMLLYAGKSLQIGGGATLSAQAISGNDIIIRDNAYLQYPSLLYTGQEFSAERQEIIIDIKGQSMIDGTIIYPVQTNNFTSGLFRVKVSDQASVRGGIYTLGQTELEGTVLGSVLTRQFYFYESPSSYINYLRDATIDFSARPRDYVVPLGFSENPQYQFLDWFEVQ